MTFQPSDAFKQVRIPQPTHAQPGGSSWRNRFAASPVSHGLRHLASVGKSRPLRLTSSRSRGRACSLLQLRRALHSRHFQATSPPCGQARLAGRTIGHVGHPQCIGRIRVESTLHQIRCWPLTRVTPGCHDVSSTPADALQACLAHQASHTLAANCHALVT